MIWSDRDDHQSESDECDEIGDEGENDWWFEEEGRRGRDEIVGEERLSRSDLH